MREPKRATLLLEDGTRFEGKSFGFPASTSGEVVFNTAMTGYPESLPTPLMRARFSSPPIPSSETTVCPPADASTV